MSLTGRTSNSRVDSGLTHCREASTWATGLTTSITATLFSRVLVSLHDQIDGSNSSINSIISHRLVDDALLDGLFDDLKTLSNILLNVRVNDIAVLVHALRHSVRHEHGQQHVCFVLVSVHVPLVGGDSSV